MKRGKIKRIGKSDQDEKRSKIKQNGRVLRIKKQNGVQIQDFQRFNDKYESVGV
jgi:hypothetical protein